MDISILYITATIVQWNISLSMGGPDSTKDSCKTSQESVSPLYDILSLPYVNCNVDYPICWMPTAQANHKQSTKF